MTRTHGANQHADRSEDRSTDPANAKSRNSGGGGGGRKAKTRRRSRTGGGSRQLDKYLRRVAEDEATARGSDGGGEGAGAGGYSEWCGRRIQAWWRMVGTK